MSDLIAFGQTRRNVVIHFVHQLFFHRMYLARNVLNPRSIVPSLFLSRAHAAGKWVGNVPSGGVEIS